MPLWSKIGKNFATKAAKGIPADATRMGALFHYAATHPWQTTGGVIATAAVLNQNSSRVQAIPAGPTQFNVRPGSSRAASDYDLGASGDIVFALAKLG